MNVLDCDFTTNTNLAEDIIQRQGDVDRTPALLYGDMCGVDTEGGEGEVTDRGYTW